MSSRPDEIPLCCVVVDELRQPRINRKQRMDLRNPERLIGRHHGIAVRLIERNLSALAVHLCRGHARLLSRVGCAA
jgi:hypothetical protein